MHKMHSFKSISKHHSASCSQFKIVITARHTIHKNIDNFKSLFTVLVKMQDISRLFVNNIRLVVYM